MGSFNGTCGITQLPIEAGDKIRLFILLNEENRTSRLNTEISEHEGGGFCGTNGFWSPFGPAIECEYNDYGSVENITENKNAQIQLSHLKDRIRLLETCRLKYYNFPKKDKMSLGNLIKAIERGSVIYNDPIFGKDLNVGFMMVHEDIYQSMISYDHIEAIHNDNGYMYKSYRNKLLSIPKNWYERCLNIVLNYEKDDVFSAMMELSQDYPLYENSDESGIRKYKNILNDYAKQKLPLENNEVKEALNLLSEYIVFLNSMQSARKSWFPQGGKGSQDSDFDIHKIINKASLKFIKDKEKISIEDGGEVKDKNGYFPYQLEHNKKMLANIIK